MREHVKGQGFFTIFLLAAFCINWFIPSHGVAEYGHYAHAALVHPGVAWPKEYPPAALGVFLLPLILPIGYRLAFMILTVAAYLLLGRIVGTDPIVRRRMAVYLFLATMAIGLQRYDVFAVIPTILGVRAAHRGKWTRAWAWSLVGVWLKLYPVVFWPLWLIAEWRATGKLRWSRLGVGMALAVAPSVAVSVWSGHGHWIQFLADRPPNLGSVPGDLAAILTGNYSYRWAFGSLVVAAPIAPLVAHVTEAIGLILMAGVIWTYFRQQIGLDAAEVLLLWLLILCSKVFSPQYVIWAAPLMATFAIQRLWVYGSFATTMAFPVAYVFRSPLWIGEFRAVWYGIANLLFGVGLWVFWHRTHRVTDDHRVHPSPGIGG